MTDNTEELNSKWETFIQSVSNLHKLKNLDIQIQQVNAAIEISEEFIASNFILCSAERYRRWAELTTILSDYYDHKNKVIRAAARVYFTAMLAKHGLESYEYEIEFARKKDGLSCGCVCILKLPTSIERYFVKTYQNGPLMNGDLAKGPPNAREILIYKFLEKIHISGEMHFIVGSGETTRSFYIAMKEVNYISLSKLDDNTDIRPLIIIDYLTRILRLNDVGSNYSNCGIDPSDQPVIIDFRTEEESSFNITDSELVDYFEGHCGCSWIDIEYHRYMKKAVKVKKEVKMNAIREFQANFDIYSLLDASLIFTKEFCKNWKGKLNIRADGIDDYVKSVKQNIEIFSSHF